MAKLSGWTFWFSSLFYFNSIVRAFISYPGCSESWGEVWKFCSENIYSEVNLGSKRKSYSMASCCENYFLLIIFFFLPGVPYWVFGERGWWEMENLRKWYWEGKLKGLKKPISLELASQPHWLVHSPGLSLAETTGSCQSISVCDTTSRFKMGSWAKLCVF